VQVLDPDGFSSPSAGPVRYTTVMPALRIVLDTVWRITVVFLCLRLDTIMFSVQLDILY
jgi:hypothetical protein